MTRTISPGSRPASWPATFPGSWTSRYGTVAAVIPLWGQSNMVGFDSSDTSFDAGDYPLANMFQVSRGLGVGDEAAVALYLDTNVGSDGDIIPAYQPLQHQRNLKGKGLGFYFARAYAQAHPDHDVILVPGAEGSTGFAAEWNHTTGTLYLQEVGRIDTLLTTLAADYDSVIIPAWLWHQGEAEKNNSAWHTTFAAMIAAVRTRYSAYGDIPFVAGTLATAGSGGINTRVWSMMETVDNFAAADLMTLGKFDAVHLSGQGLEDAGAAYWTAYNKMLSGDSSRLFVTNDDTSQLPTATGTWRLYEFDDLTDTSGNGGIDLTDPSGEYFLNRGICGFNGDVYFAPTDFTTGDPRCVSIVCKFRCGDQSSGVERYLTGSNPFHFYLHTDGTLRWVVDTTIISSPSAVDDGDWHIAGATYNRTNGQMRLYLDGALVASGTDATNEGALNDFWIGEREGAATQFFGGEMDHLWLDHSLSAVVSQANMETATTLS